MKKLKKPVSILLSFVMVFGLLASIPFHAGAAEAITYFECSWDGEKVVKTEKTCTDYTKLDEETQDMNLTEGWYFINQGTNIPRRLMVESGTVNLIVGYAVAAPGGIGVAPGATLNLYSYRSIGGGILNITFATTEENMNNAGIGGTNGNAGTINIHDVNIEINNDISTDQWAGKGAGIGGGYSGAPESVTIYDGSIHIKTATGACIGGGYYGPASRSAGGEGIRIYDGYLFLESINGAGIGNGYGQDGSPGSIAIYDGLVRSASKNGAGIGGGWKGRNGQIDIYGGEIQAISTGDGAGIGSGGEANQIADINIHGGTIIAQAACGAGIGAGKFRNSTRINITGGEVNACSYSGGAAIGAGERNTSVFTRAGGRASEINISNAMVTAMAYNVSVKSGFLQFVEKYSKIMKSTWERLTASGTDFLSIKGIFKFFGGLISEATSSSNDESFGAGIGAGACGEVGVINIKNSSVAVQGGNHSAGIGSSQRNLFGTINIIDSNVTGKGGDGAAGIGSGDKSEGNGKILISGSTVDITGGGAGAGIGTGYDTKKEPCKIEIVDGSTVTATGGNSAAGIGSGKISSGSGGYITITDSTVTAVSPKNGAGIGTGNKSEVSLGPVTISHSTVTATGGTEAAGIGTGNESTVKAFDIKIKDHSTVTATGGEYGAGIGGGDNTSCGKVTITDSKVTAKGGKDAAGIGGGEDGKGGEVSILGNSNVYAEGKHYGAGIGGGEDGDGNAFSVSGRSTVEAVAGSEGWGKAIGYGDFNVFSVPSTGSVSISNGLRVKAGKSSDKTEDYTAGDRFDAMCNYKYAKIYPCGHERAVLKYHDYSAHAKYCADCREWVYDSYEDHIWDDDYVCTVCGGTATLATMTIEQKDSDGSVMTKQTTAPLHTDFTLPECTSAPDGKAFVCWRDKNHMDCYAPGETVKLENTTYEAIYMTLEETPFIDADGSQQTVPARVFDGTDEALVLTDGWYVFKGTHEFQEKIRIKGNISMILEDGCLFKGCVPEIDLTLIECRSVAVLSLYGQSGQTGTLDIASNRFTVTDLRLYGGVVHSDRSFGGKLSTYIKGGTVNAKSLTNPRFGTVISGGSVTVTGKSVLVNDYEFGWSNLTDSISLGGFLSQGRMGSITITDGQAFSDEDGNIYVDSLSYDQIMALEGKTLTPYFNYHQYGEPEWVWSEHNNEATAVFTCTKEGCGDVRRVEAKVEFNVDGDDGVYTAECTFFGQKYTAEKRVTLRHGITINVNGGGTVTADQEKPKAGDDVELTVTPDSGYTLLSLSVTDAEGHEVWLDGNIFEMPDYDVTVDAEFIAVVPEREPSIDENGAYVLGNIAYCVRDGINYEVDENGVIGEAVEDVTVSYFDFELLDDDTYRIRFYTGPAEDLTELVIPKSYNGKPVTVLGNFGELPFIKSSARSPFVLILNENIREIGNRAFKEMRLTAIRGDTSGLNNLGKFALSTAYSQGGFKLDLSLDYPGEITVQEDTFYGVNVTVHMKHSARFSITDLIKTSLTYDFTDAHTYGNPSWSWQEDCKAADAVFTCTDNRCKHKETVHAQITTNDEVSQTTYTAQAQFGGESYTDSKTIRKTKSDVSVEPASHGTVSADKNEPFEGETVTLTVIPEAGYKLSALRVRDADDHPVEVTDNKFVMPRSNVTITAEFAQKAYTVSYAEAEGGWVSGVYAADFGDNIEPEIVPAAGYEFDKITVTCTDGTLILPDSQHFTMPDSDVVVAVTFRKANLNISYETDGNGSVTGPDTAQFNDLVSLTVKADEGYALYNLYADNAWGETADIYENNTFYMLDNNVTVHAEFVPVIPAKAPNIDENGEYHLGNVAYCDIGGMYFSVKDGVVDKELDSIDVSYFDFRLLSDDTYQISHYTGPTQDLTEIVIPKSYDGKPVTTLGSGGYDVFIVSNDTKPQFTLTLNENIREIREYTFYTMWVKEVRGDTSGLHELGDFAFSWANSKGGYTLDLSLDYPGEITVGYETFNNMNVTAHIKHSAHFSRTSLHLNSLTYVFTDEHTYGNPYWSWAYDFSSAEATFACTDKRCRHEETVDATVTGETVGETATYHATAAFCSNTYTDTKSVYTDRIGARLVGHSISLEGDIGVNFYMELTGDVAYSETAYMHFTIPTGSTTTESDVYVKDANIVSSDGKKYYVFKCRVAAKEMTSDIKAQIIDGDRSGTEYTYSVKDYADYLLSHTGENEEWDKAVPLVKAMLNYGAYSQVYFDKNPEKLANAGLTTEEKTLGDVSIDIAEPVISDLPGDTTFEGATLSLKSVTTLSLYFRSSQTLNFDCQGYTVETVSSGDYQIARIRGFKSDRIGDTITLTVNGTGTATYSPLNYCKKVLTLSTSTEDEAKNEKTLRLQNTVKALYWYWQAACDYFSE